MALCTPYPFGFPPWAEVGYVSAHRITYSSVEEGRPEVYVRPFPNVDDDRVKVSQNGGFSPRWGPNSDELFYQTYRDEYREPGIVTIMMVPIDAEPALSPGSPVPLFSGPYRAGNLETQTLSPTMFIQTVSGS